VAGSSAYFDYGFVTYSNEAKMKLIGVPAETLAATGAVSERVVAAMAQGALAAAGADVAVAVSGIAGPDGGTAEKPVGTVCFGLAAKGNGGDLPGGVWTKTLHLWGNRTDVRDRTATHALAMIRRYLLGQKV
jgi:PncC family amidohydrolase